MSRYHALDDGFMNMRSFRRVRLCDCEDVTPQGMAYLRLELSQALYYETRNTKSLSCHPSDAYII